MPRRRFLMCPPTFYRVDYTINPWMDPDTWDDEAYRMAQSQWSSLLYTLICLKADIELLTPHPEFPDMVFVANGGAFDFQGRVEVARFRHEERRKENKFFYKKFHSLGYKVEGYIDYDQLTNTTYGSISQNHPEPDYFEGAGDHIYDPYREITWRGYGFRSTKNDWGMANLELVDSRFYHLDTCFCPLSDGEVMYYPRAFSKDSLDIIHDRVKRKHRIEIDEDDALKFAANAIVLDHDIILSGCTMALQNTLEHKDYIVHKIPLTAFHLAGGSAACLTLRLPEPPPRE